MKTIHLFAGAGGGILSDLILGHEPVAAYEWDAYCCQVLRERVEDGWFPGMRVHEGDIRLQDTSEYKGKVDCIHAGFPCTDISVAGNQKGIGEDTRSGLYREVLRISDEVRPDYIFLENVSAIVTGADGEWLRTILGDLADRGYNAVWQNISAAQVRACHKRNRWWLLAYPSTRQQSRKPGFQINRCSKCNNGVSDEAVSEECENVEDVGYPKHNGQPTTKITGSIEEGGNGNKKGQKPTSKPSGSGEQHENVADTISKRQSRQRKHINPSNQEKDREGQASDVVYECERSEREAEFEVGMLANDVSNNMVRWNSIESEVGRVTNETENRADKLKALGNAQVPLQAAVAFSYLWEIMESTR